MSQHLLRPTDLRDGAVDPVGRDVLPIRSGTYGFNDVSRFSVRSEPALTEFPAEISTRGYLPTLEDSVLISQRRDLPARVSPVPSRGYPSTLEDPVLIGQRRDLPARISPVPPSNPDYVYERPVSHPKVNGPPVLPGESNVLFVDGLPSDCTRREVGHIFRPFIGYKDIKVIHKEARRTGEKATVLCFVEFNDSKCALTAMDALQGYKFDDKKPTSSVLKIHFANFPFRLPSEHAEQRLATQ